MLNYFPSEITNTVTKYVPKEMITHIKKLYLTTPTVENFNWKRLFYALYGKNEDKSMYNYPKKYANEYLNKILNKMDSIMYEINDNRTITSMRFNGKSQNWYERKNGTTTIFGEYSDLDLDLDSEFKSEHEIKKYDSNERKVIKSNNKIIEMVCNTEYIIFLFENNTAIIIGNIHYSGKQYDKWKKREIVILSTNGKREKIIQISGGPSHAIILLDNGKIYAAGRNYDYQLGLDQMHDCVSEWTEIKLGKKVLQVQCGYGYSMVLLEDGTVMATGNNSFGQISCCSTSSIRVFTLIKLKYNSTNSVINELINERATQISCCENSSMILLEDGRVLASCPLSKNLKMWELIKPDERTIYIVCEVLHSIIISQNGGLLMKRSMFGSVNRCINTNSWRVPFRFE